MMRSIIVAIIVALVIVSFAYIILGINPVQIVKDMLPSFITGSQNEYQGLCRLEKADWQQEMSYSYKTPVIFIKGNEDCKGDTLEIDVYKDELFSKDSIFAKGLKAKFGDNDYVYIIDELRSNYVSFEKGNYYFTLTIDGIKPLTTKGKVFEKSGLIRIPIS